MITFENTGISINSTKSGRTLVYTDIIRDGVVYHWTIYVPTLVDTTLTDYLISNADVYEADIIAKEEIWANMPHTKEIVGIDGQLVTVDIQKEEIVCASTPDYEENASNVNSDVSAIKRLLQKFTNSILSDSTLTEQDIKDLTTIHDYWVINKLYKVNDICDYCGELYKCVGEHTSSVDSKPVNTELYWEKIII